VFKGVNERKRDRMKRSVREKETMWLDILKMCWREKECVLKKVKERKNERDNENYQNTVTLQIFFSLTLKSTPKLMTSERQLIQQGKNHLFEK